MLNKALYGPNILEFVKCNNLNILLVQIAANFIQLIILDNFIGYLIKKMRRNCLLKLIFELKFVFIIEKMKIFSAFVKIVIYVVNIL